MIVSAPISFNAGAESRDRCMGMTHGGGLPATSSDDENA
jgi:hypothetical protein